MPDLYADVLTNVLWEVAADQAGDLYEDTGGTDTCEDGDDVAAWRSTSNGSLSSLATQSTVGDRPTYNADVGDGYPGVSFNGSDDQLSIPHHADWNMSALTVFAVVEPAAVQASYHGIWARDDRSGWDTPILYFQTGTKLVWGGPGYVLNQNPSVTPTLNRMVLAMRYDGTHELINLNNASIGSREVSTAILSHSEDGILGCLPNGSWAFNGSIHHFIVCDAALSLTAIEQAVNLLGDRWGVTIVDPPEYGTGGGAGGFPRSRLLNG